MKLQEYQAKEILLKFGLPVQPGTVTETVQAAEQIADRIGLPVVIKAQVLVGGRGKAGGVKIARTPQEVTAIAGQILGMQIKDLPVKKVLIAGAVEFEKEYYLGITVDRSSKSNVLMFSEEGGVEIEEVAKTNPEQISRLTLTPPLPLGEGGDFLMSAGVRAIAENLAKAYLASDATLAEINPLVKTKDLPAGRHGGKFIALDAKMVIDDNALFRQPELAKLQEDSAVDELEAEAGRRQIAYVRLPGNIGIIGNGAGLVMTTMDEVKRAGGQPGCFLDLGGGAQADKVKATLELLLMDKNLKGIFFNIFGGITRCDEVAKGIIKAMETLNIHLPIVVRLTGTSEEEGRALLRQTSLVPVQTMQEGARKIVEHTR